MTISSLKSMALSLVASSLFGQSISFAYLVVPHAHVILNRSQTLKNLAFTSLTTRAAVLPRLFQRLSIALGDTASVVGIACQVSPQALAKVHTLDLAIRIEDEGITDDNIKLTASYIGYIVHRLLSLRAVEVSLVVAADFLDRKVISAFVDSTLFNLYCRTARTLQSLNPQLIVQITLWDKHASRSLITGSDDWRDLLQWPGRHSPSIAFSQYAVVDAFVPVLGEDDESSAEQQPLSIRSFIRSHNLRRLPIVQQYGVVTRLDLTTQDLEVTASECLAVTMQTLKVLILQDWSDDPINLRCRVIELPKLTHLRIKYATIPFGLLLLQTLQCPILMDLDFGVELARGQAESKPDLLYHSLATFFQTSRAILNVLFRFEGTTATWRDIAPALDKARRKILSARCCMALEFSSVYRGQPFESADCFNLATSSLLQSSMTSLQLCTSDHGHQSDYSASQGTYPRVTSCMISRGCDPEIDVDPPQLHEFARKCEVARIEAESLRLGETIKYMMWLHRMPHLQRLHIDIIGLHYERALPAILTLLDEFPELHELQVDISPPRGGIVPLALPNTFVDQCAQRGVTAVNRNIMESRSLAHRERRRQVGKLQK